MAMVVVVVVVVVIVISESKDLENYATFVFNIFKRIWNGKDKFCGWWLVVGCWWLVLVVGSRVRGHGGCRGRSRGHRHQRKHGCRELC